MNIQEIEAKQKSQKSQKWRNFFGFMLLFLLAVGIWISIVEFSWYQTVEKPLNADLIEIEKSNLDLQELRGLQSEGEAWDRLTKLKKSARTEEERAFVQSEAAKLRALSAERKRVLKAAREELARRRVS